MAVLSLLAFSCNGDFAKREEQANTNKSVKSIALKYINEHNLKEEKKMLVQKVFGQDNDKVEAKELIDLLEIFEH